MKTPTCEKCRKAIAKAVSDEYSRNQYDIYAACSDDIAKAVTSAFIAVFKRRGYSKKYVQKLFNEFLLILDMPEIFGKQISSNFVMETVKNEYGIDLDRVKLRLESREEYEHRYRISENRK